MLESAFRDAKEYGPEEGDEYVLNRYLILLGPRLIICFLQYTHFIFSPINIVISPANNSPY